MQTQQWVNRSHPQTLVIATILLYFNAVFGVLFGQEPGLVRAGLCLVGLCIPVDFLFRIVVSAGFGAAGYLIANDKKNGYKLGVGMATLVLAARLIIAVRLQISPFSGDVIGLMFDVALFALLVHPQSRDYQRIWFR